MNRYANMLVEELIEKSEETKIRWEKLKSIKSTLSKSKYEARRKEIVGELQGIDQATKTLLSLKICPVCNRSNFIYDSEFTNEIRPIYRRCNDCGFVREINYKNAVVEIEHSALIAGYTGIPTQRFEVQILKMFLEEV